MSQEFVGNNHWLDDRGRPDRNNCRTLRNANRDEMEINIHTGDVKLTLHNGQVITVLMDDLEDTLDACDVSAFGWQNIRQLRLVHREV